MSNVSSREHPAVPSAPIKSIRSQSPKLVMYEVFSSSAWVDGSIDEIELAVTRESEATLFSNVPDLIVLIANLYTIEPRKVFFDVISSGLRFILSTSASKANTLSVNFLYATTASALPTVAPLCSARVAPTFTAPSTIISPAFIPLIVSKELFTSELSMMVVAVSMALSLVRPELNSLPMVPRIFELVDVYESVIASSLTR